jgi:hypothetical protein
MDLRGEEGESCIAAEESKCNRLTRYRRKALTVIEWRTEVQLGGEEERATEGEEGTEALVINLCRGSRAP